MRRRKVEDYPVLRASQIEIARLAAFIDGEGCIMVNRTVGQRKYVATYLIVVVTNTDPRLTQWCLKNFGGSVYSTKKVPPRRDIYKWTVTCKEAEMVLRACLPHFVMKREQAELGLVYQETIGVNGKKVLPSVRQERDLIRQQMKDLRWQSVSLDELSESESVN